DEHDDREDVLRRFLVVLAILGEAPLARFEQLLGAGNIKQLAHPGIVASSASLSDVSQKEGIGRPALAYNGETGPMQVRTWPFFFRRQNSDGCVEFRRALTQRIGARP